jgi:hypothetical protein
LVGDFPPAFFFEGFLFFFASPGQIKVKDLVQKAQAVTGRRRTTVSVFEE